MLLSVAGVSLNGVTSSSDDPPERHKSLKSIEMSKGSARLGMSARALRVHARRACVVGDEVAERERGNRSLRNSQPLHRPGRGRQAADCSELDRTACNFTHCFYAPSRFTPPSSCRETPPRELSLCVQAGGPTPLTLTMSAQTAKNNKNWRMLGATDYWWPRWRAACLLLLVGLRTHHCLCGKFVTGRDAEEK